MTLFSKTVLKTSSKRDQKAARQLERAVQLHRSGDRASAVRIYHKILKSDPDNSDALNLLGMAAHQAGKLEEAIRLMRRAVASMPENSAALRNLGNLLIESDDFADAVRYYRQASALDPGDASIYANLSVAYRRLNDVDQAVDAGRQAVRMDPTQMIAWYNLANAWRAGKQFRKAIDAYRKALALNPGFTPARDNLCRTTLSMESTTLLGRRTLRKTRKAYREWLQQEPENPLPQFMLNAVEGKEVPRAPDSVVTGMFDRSSATFEEHLARLEYRVPQVMEQTLNQELGEPTGKLAVLDGGCGTGLCARYLRPYARFLVGVDLSSGMLEKARRKKFYDTLIEAELGAFLEASDEQFDLVVFADTLCYFGDLSPVLRSVKGVLSTGGLLVFSVEKGDESVATTGYRLHPHGRYSHTQSYVEKTLNEFGFVSVTCRTETLRLEIGEPVAGLLVVARA